jgi:hypothetical protein
MSSSFTCLFPSANEPSKRKLPLKIRINLRQFAFQAAAFGVDLMAAFLIFVVNPCKLPTGHGLLPQFKWA